MTDEEKMQEILKKSFTETYKKDIEITRQIAEDFHSKGEYRKRKALNWVADTAEKYLNTQEYQNKKVNYMS